MGGIRNIFFFRRISYIIYFLYDLGLHGLKAVELFFFAVIVCAVIAVQCRDRMFALLDSLRDGSRAVGSVAHADLAHYIFEVRVINGSVDTFVGNRNISALRSVDLPQKSVLPGDVPLPVCGTSKLTRYTRNS